MIGPVMIDSTSNRVVRATLRCLVEDLAEGIAASEIRAALRTLSDDLAADSNHLLPEPLVDIAHPVLDKANLIAGDEAARRERIKSIVDRDVIKVKTGNR